MRLIRKRGKVEIDRAEIDELLAARKFIGLNKSPRSEKVIVSLTSYLPRIHDVKYTIYSLLNQNFPPDELILWLDEDSMRIYQSGNCSKNWHRLLTILGFGL